MLTTMVNDRPALKRSVVVRVLQRIGQVFCRHEDQIATGGGRSFLRCIKCDRQTAGWDVKGNPPGVCPKG